MKPGRALFVCAVLLLCGLPVLHAEIEPSKANKSNRDNKAKASAPVLKPTPIPAASGLYESYSPLQMKPVAPLLASKRKLLARYLEVSTQGQRSTIKMMPAGRIVWLVDYGPHGVTRKETQVDGEQWTVSIFKYDTKGHLVSKEVTGPGAHGQTLKYSYTTDTEGRVLARTPAQNNEARLEIQYGDWGAKIKWKKDKSLIRIDKFDAEGRLKETAFATDMRLLYERSAKGTLRGVFRQFDTNRNGTKFRANHTKPLKGVGPSMLDSLEQSVAERHEVLLLLGDPPKSSTDGQGIKRSTHDEYSNSCWLNEVSGLDYDPADMLLGGSTSCICGFCVDANLAIDAVDVQGQDHHWTQGPWMRLDEAVDVTADHRVMTPTGPVMAGDLKAGDVVLNSAGQPHTLESVRRLPAGPARKGLNVRTQSGVFAAGGILFESETARACPMIP